MYIISGGGIPSYNQTMIGNWLLIKEFIRGSDFWLLSMYGEGIGNMRRGRDVEC